MPIDVNRFRLFPDTLKAYQGNGLLVTGVHGHIRCRLEGFYRHQTRFLSRLTFTVNGEEPKFSTANGVEPYSQIAYYLASSANGDAGSELVDKGLVIQVDRFVGGGLHQDFHITNHSLTTARVELAFRVDADFADQGEAAKGKRQQQAPITREWRRNGGVWELEFRYEHPKLNHAAIMSFSDVQGGPELRGDEVVYHLELPPRRPHKLCLEVSPVFLGDRVDPRYCCGAFASHDTVGDRVRDRWLRGAVRLHSPNHRVSAAWERAIADLGSLALLDGSGARALTPAAGVPLYQALFGRDSLTTSWQASTANPLMLRGTLETIADWLGKRYDDRYDEQPGRVIHQHQLSPLSLLGHNPYYHYYGDYAGPGVFVIGLAWYFWLTGDREFVRSMREPALRCLAWMDRDGDRDGDGFYEYDTRAGAKGTKNQGWKDSPEAILTAEGQNVEDPLAVVEVQGYYYAAKQQLGLVMLALGDVALGGRLLAEAADLKKRFNKAFWMPEEQFYALALGPDKQQVRSIASNVGQALACGIIDSDRARTVADRLMAPDMFSGWGIRTLSSDHPAYNPFTYHLGSVWPSENATIALGLRRYGFAEHTQRLAQGLFDATRLFDADRLPEVMSGNPRDPLHPHPGIYPNSNAPQAWSASAIVMLVQALVGLVPVAPLHVLLVDPVLPEWLPDLTLEHIPVGDARVSLHFRRDASGHTDYRVTEKQGRVRVLRQAPPNSLDVGLGSRVADLAKGILLPW